MRSVWASGWIVGVWLVLISLKVSGMGTRAVVSEPRRASASGSLSEDQVRAEMLKTLEDVVQRERFYRKRTGSFTAVLGKLEFEVPVSLRSEVDIRVTSADREHLVVEAFRDGGVGGPRERVWMDEQFRVQATFPVRDLRWVVVQKQAETAESDSLLPPLEVEPINATASSDLTAE